MIRDDSGIYGCTAYLVRCREALQVESNVRLSLRAELVAALQRDSRRFESLAPGIVGKVGYTFVCQTGNLLGTRLLQVQLSELV